MFEIKQFHINSFNYIHKDPLFGPLQYCSKVLIIFAKSILLGGYDSKISLGDRNLYMNA